MTILGSIGSRVYSDFLRPSRLGEYQLLLETALARGYAVSSVADAWAAMKVGAFPDDRPQLILRHDIDTLPRTAAAMWAIERELGVRGSWYFRLSTFDDELASAIAEDGSEVSYHYEELATVAKELHLRGRINIRRGVPEARRRFRANLEQLRARTGQPMTIVAGHGDFVNRKTGVLNTALLEDRAFRTEVGVELETYDHAFMTHVTSRHADLIRPPYWHPEGPAGAIVRREPVVYLLVHPGCWDVEPLLNARNDAVRIWQGLVYALPVKPRPTRAAARSGPSSDA